MKFKRYEEYLYDELQDPEFAAGYLTEVLSYQNLDAFLLALRDVVNALGGIGALAEHVDIKRSSLYKILSEDGNPQLNTLQEILRPLGMRLSIASIEDDEAEAA